MRIALIGQKGFPATWGGVEVHVEQIARRLARRGHRVTVFNRRWYAATRPELEPGLRVVNTPYVDARKLDAISHAVSSTLALLPRRVDVVHYHSMGPSLASPLARLAGLPIVTTIHGFDYHAAKWGPAARLVLRCGEWTALHAADRTLVVAEHMRRHYASLGVEVSCVPNGVDPLVAGPAAELERRWGLRPKSYLLFLARLEPNKGADTLLEAFARLHDNAGQARPKLVIAGTTDQAGYRESLRRTATADVLFVGSVEGQLKATLMTNAMAFVTPSCLEGLPLALLEAMSAGVPIVASDIPAHRELLTHQVSALLYEQCRPECLLQALQDLSGLGEQQLQALGTAAAAASTAYSWDTTVDRLEPIYADAARVRSKRATGHGRA